MEEKLINVLTEEFLAELYNAAIGDDFLCSLLAKHMRDEYLPDKQYQTLNNALKGFFLEHKVAPKFGMMKQIVTGSRAVSELLDEIRTMATDVSPEVLREQFERYLKLVMVKKALRDINKMMADGRSEDAMNSMIMKTEELNKFSLAPDQFVDVGATFEQRLHQNKERREKDSREKMVNSFYIDCLDQVNGGRNLRTQLSVFLAMSGVGKSHIARHIGKHAAYVSGLDVLHIQLEGSASEVLDAYSASLINVSCFKYETGNVSSEYLKHIREFLEQTSGTLKVKSYSRFGKEVSTLDVMNSCKEYRETFGKYPDVVVIDSLDLLSDARGKYDRAGGEGKGLRFKRVQVAQELKDLAADINAWVVATYQATIENKEWVNDEKNCLDGYNTSECKGLQRPCTHLISLNQSSREKKERMLRLYVAKARFFYSADPYRICTDYEHEIFYDRERTLNLTA